MKAITNFRGPNRWLSNFYVNPVHLDDKIFPSNEHAYMSFKCDAKVWQEACVNPEISPAKIKEMSRRVPLIEGWDNMRLSVMEKCLRAKFECPVLREKLLATGDAQLQEGNDWGDLFWGVDGNTGEGYNHLGNLIMKIRAELVIAQKYADSKTSNVEG